MELELKEIKRKEKGMEKKKKRRSKKRKRISLPFISDASRDIPLQQAKLLDEAISRELLEIHNMDLTIKKGEYAHPELIKEGQRKMLIGFLGSIGDVITGRSIIKRGKKVPQNFLIEDTFAETVSILGSEG